MSPPITWRNVQGPNYRGANALNIAANKNLNNAITSGSEAIQGFGDVIIDQNTGEAITGINAMDNRDEFAGASADYIAGLGPNVDLTRVAEAQTARGAALDTRFNQELTNTKNQQAIDAGVFEAANRQELFNEDRALAGATLAGVNADNQGQLLDNKTARDLHKKTKLEEDYTTNVDMLADSYMTTNEKGEVVFDDKGFLAESTNANGMYSSIPDKYYTDKVKSIHDASGETARREQAKVLEKRTHELAVQNLKNAGGLATAEARYTGANKGNGKSPFDKMRAYSSIMKDSFGDLTDSDAIKLNADLTKYRNRNISQKSLNDAMSTYLQRYGTFFAGEGGIITDDQDMDSGIFGRILSETLLLEEEEEARKALQDAGT